MNMRHQKPESRHRLLKAALLFLCTLLASPLLAGSESVRLTEDGVPKVVVVVPEEPDEEEREAAAELIQHIGEMAGATAPKVSAGEDLPDGLTPVYLGRAAPDALLARIREEGNDPQSFILRVRPDRIDVRGLGGGAGTLIGVYELLEQLGMRWFAPGDFFTVTPDKATLALERQETVQVPSFKMRHMRGGAALHHDRGGLWRQRNRMPGVRRPVGRHGMPPLGRFDPKHPDRYGIVHGKLNKKKGVYNVSNPDTLEAVVDHIVKKFEKNPDMERFIYSTGTHDHPLMDERPESRALDAGVRNPFSGMPSQTDRWVWFYNRVLERFDERLPDKELEIAFYAYGNKMLPPQRWEPDERLRPTLAPIILCRRHSPLNPVCTDKHNVRQIVEGWTQHGVEMYHRGFWWNLASFGAPFPLWSRLGELIPWAHEVGIKGWSPQVSGDWGADLPNFYIGAKLMWNHEADVEALMDDFAEKFFGSASEPMREYYRMIDEANHDADHHTGSSWDVPHIYDPELRARGRSLIENAAALVDAAGHDEESLYARRVQMVRDIWAYTDAFCRMMEARKIHAWQASYEAFQELEKLRKQLEKPLTDPSEKADTPAITNHGGQKAGRFTKLFGQPTVDAYERVTDGNAFVAGLDHEWDFLLDRHKVGEQLGYYRAGEIGGNWQRILTSTSWSNQGLHHYKGEAWYRQEVFIPERFAGERIFLWFGGVHNQAKVWVNGEMVGKSHTRSFRPFEFDATDAVRPGERNTVAVRASSTRVREVGVGGLLAPAFFYAPVEGEAAEPAYPLEDEFPVPLRQIKVQEGHIP